MTSQAEIHLLGITASRRKMGNSELLLKEALRSARDDGARVQIMRLPDFNFENCRGCLKCLFQSEECPIDDDINLLISAVRAAKGIIVGAPTYAMFPPGIIKLIIDRGGHHYLMRDELQEQKAGIISVAGRKDWDYFTIPMLSMFLYTLNMKKLEIVDSISVYSPGPGQALLDRSNVENASRLGRRVVAAIRGGRSAKKEPADRCPVCNANFFMLDPAGVTCPICLSRGTRENDKICWDHTSTKTHRYTSEKTKEFVDLWIRKTRRSYREESRRIVEARKIYKDTAIKIPWVRKDGGK